MFWQYLKRGSIFTGILILGPIVGCLLSGAWIDGGSTFWKPIDYFPLRVAKIIALEEFGHEFWVETTDNALYHVIYPCPKGETCWGKIEVVPEVSHGVGEYRIKQNKCENDGLVYPLFRKIKMCITSIVLAPDANWKVSLALTDDHKMWIWQKLYDDPFGSVILMMFATLVGVLLGFIVGVIAALKIP